MARWQDTEGLFTPGKDYLVAEDGEEMTRRLRALLEDPASARAVARHGRQTVLARHTCAHRVDELLAIYRELEGGLPGTENGVAAGSPRDLLGEGAAVLR